MKEKIMNVLGNASAKSVSHSGICSMTSLVAIIILFAFSTGLQAADRDVVVDGNTRFALDLYQKLKADRKGQNIFLSPFSISTALAMTYTGARGETEKQITQTLHFALPQQQLHPAFSALQADLQSSKGYELAIANRLWGQKDYPFLKDFLKFVDTHYRGGFDEVDYLRDPQGSRKIINRWVEEKTKEKIKDLLLPEDITNLTRLVLTNAIYFKGSWISKFDTKNTIQAPFRLEDGKTVTTPLMSQTGQFKYLDTETLELLELPYVGDRLSMLVLLPRKGIELEKVEQILTSENLRAWRSSMEDTGVRVFLPKFKTLTRFELNDSLIALGMKDAFDEDLADFSGIPGKKDLYISKVIHKAFVDVNEEGTEAAASTAVVMSTKSMRIEPIFRADHPFIFAILDKQSGSILFLGRLMNPQ
jgi:serpin B